MTSLLARRKSAGPPAGFAGIDVAAFPNLTAALTAPPSPSAPRDLFEAMVRSAAHR
ncbi:hypothetical protein [Micromonospora sp. NBC_00421]|uniref:hypothetical protein n=1 Tax=Micromonospora sp. NBC_00421 TaxID=2975976 RepID=UPI002E1D9F34